MTWDHELKIWPPHFEHLNDGRRRFDVRRNDRRFRVGDVIKYREWVPKEHGATNEPYYTGRNLLRRVRFLLSPRADRDPDCGLVPGYVIFDLDPIETVEETREIRTEPETEHAA